MSATSVSYSTGSTTTGYWLGSLVGTTRSPGWPRDTDQIIPEEMAIYQQPVTRRKIGQLGNRISVMQAALNEKQNMLVQQFAQLEAALSGNQSTSTWLTSQLAALRGSA